MKKINRFIAWGYILCAVGVAACSDDKGGKERWEGKSVVVDAAAYDAWTYFNFKTGASRTIQVKAQEGGIAGMYKGDLEIKMMGETFRDMKLIISTLSKDTVMVSMDSLELSMREKPIGKFGFSSKATVKKEANQWVLAGIPTELKAGKITFENVSFSGTIGSKKGTQAKLTLTFQPQGMPMPIVGEYTATVGDNKTYALDGDETSFDWHIAFHKYDIKTNGGTAVKLNTQDLASVTLSSVAKEHFTADTDGKQVMVDMTKMTQGFVGYQLTKLNSVLCGWVTATPTGSMPPYTYELNRNIFVVKTAGGEYAKIRFSDYSNDKNKKVYAAFDYEFPLK